MDPTDEQIDGFNTVLSIAQWVELPGDPGEANSAMARLFALLGTNGTQHPRVLGCMPETDYTALLEEWTYGEPDAPPTPVCKVQAGLIGRVARIKCGIDKTQKALREEKEVADRASAAAAASASVTGASSTSKTRKVKLSTIVSQSNEDEVELISDEKVNGCFKHYKDITGGFPPPHKECTIEQLTGLASLVNARAAPYVDFNIWGPHQYRIMKKLKLQGMVLMPGGDMKMVEIAGPSAFPLWQTCYDVLETGLVQLDIVKIARTSNYHEVFKHYISRYGERVWHIMYQADVRMRQEEMPRLCRQGMEEYNTAIAAGGSHAFNPEKPWDWVWDQAVKHSSFWRRELEEPCFLVLSKAAPIQSMLDGDAAIHTETQSNAGVRGLKRSFEGQQAARSLMVQEERIHNVKDGTYESNRRGTPLCKGFQDGSCTHTVSGSRCGKNWTFSHQCEKCLSPDHGKHQCTATSDPKPSAQSPRFRTVSKGGGKGKSKGKKGKKGW